MLDEKERNRVCSKLFCLVGGCGKMITISSFPLQSAFDGIHLICVNNVSLIWLVVDSRKDQK